MKFHYVVYLITISSIRFHLMILKHSDTESRNCYKSFMTQVHSQALAEQNLFLMSCVIISSLWIISNWQQTLSPSLKTMIKFTKLYFTISKSLLSIMWLFWHDLTFPCSSFWCCLWWYRSWVWMQGSPPSRFSSDPTVLRLLTLRCTFPEEVWTQGSPSPVPFVWFLKFRRSGIVI